MIRNNQQQESQECLGTPLKQGSKYLLPQFSGCEELFVYSCQEIHPLALLIQAKVNKKAEKHKRDAPIGQARQSV